MKKYVNVLAAAVMAVVVFVGCGRAESIEAYYKDHPDELKEMSDKVDDDGLKATVECEDNTLIFYIKYEEDLDPEYIDAMKKEFNENASIWESQEKEVKDMKEALIKEVTTNEDVTIRFVYQDSKGNEIASHDYK